MNADETVDFLEQNAVEWIRGNRFEDFALGQKFTHHWGRTVTESDNTLFSTLTLAYNPAYTNASHARAQGLQGSPVNPLLVFNVVFGLSVEDLSEGGGPFLGVDDLQYLQPVYPGDTLYAESEVIQARLADKRPGYGIVQWHTVGRNEAGVPVIEFKRANLVRTKG
ncbi:MAG: MaoC family dehydratase [Burkholderiaceae bacterium]|nr:MaoC family dehydratase [Burkholderiaceae bacterium]